MTHLNASWMPRGVLLAMVSGLIAPAAVAGTVWQNAWTYTAPPNLSSLSASHAPPAPVAFAAGGEVLFAGVNPSPQSAQITRLDGSGNLRWIVNTDYNNFLDFAAANDLIANDDGSAFAAIGAEGGSRVARVTSSGMLAWVRDLPVDSLAKLPGDRLAAAGCTKLAVLGASTGDLLWEKNASGNIGCARGVLTDGTGHIYASFVRDNNLQLMKLDIEGNIVFEVNAGESVFGDVRSLVGLDAVSVYIRINDELRALRRSDGAVVWTRQFDDWHSTINAPDATAEPVLLGSSSIRRLSASTGYPRWSRSLTNGHFAASVGNDILVQADASLLRLHPAIGLRLWSTPLPTVDEYGGALRWHAFGGLSNGRIVGIGRAHQGSRAPVPFVQPIDFSSGELLPRPPVPLVAQGVDGWSELQGTQLIGAAHVFAPTGPEVRIRSVDTQDGETRWATIDPILAGTPGHHSDALPQLKVEDDLVAVASAWARADGTTSAARVLRVGLYDRATGGEFWNVSVEQESGSISVLSPAFDDNGNVFVGINVFDTCGMIECNYAWLYKLSRQTGAVLWSKRRSSWMQSPEVFGNDVLQSGLAENLVLWSGADGSVVWSNDVFTDGSTSFAVYRVDDRHVIFTSEMNSAKVDVRTGQTVWSVANSALACVQFCQTQARLVLPDGDALTTHNENAQVVVRVYHNDGSGVVDKWAVADDGLMLGTFTSTPILAPSGDIFLAMRRSLRGTSVGVSFMSRFDPATGALSAQQAFAARPFDPGSASRGWQIISAPTDTSVLVRGDIYEPTLPVTTGVALLDTRVLAHGDLSATLSVDEDAAATGQWIGFRMTVSYSGDQPIASARLRGYLPWQGGVRALNCTTQNASNCAVDTRFNSVNATFDILSGGSISIDGQARLVDADGFQHYFGVATYGPISLSEADTANNFARHLYGEVP